MINKFSTSLVISSLFIGILITSIWFIAHYPMKPLYVELVNDTDTFIPSVIIEHGKPDLQESIRVVQLKARESRVIALNHDPGLGFNIAVNYSDEQSTEICAGKSKDYWFFRETITKFGIYTTPIR